MGFKIEMIVAILPQHGAIMELVFSHIIQAAEKLVLVQVLSTYNYFNGNYLNHFLIGIKDN